MFGVNYEHMYRKVAMQKHTITSLGNAVSLVEYRSKKLIHSCCLT